MAGAFLKSKKRGLDPDRSCPALALHVQHGPLNLSELLRTVKGRAPGFDSEGLKSFLEGLIPL